MLLYTATLGGTYKAFGVLYIGLVDLFRAGEFRTSLVSVVYSGCSCVGCQSHTRSPLPFDSAQELFVVRKLLFCS